MNRIILCRGIGEAIDSPMLRNVIETINSKGYYPEVVNLPWSAEYGPVPTPKGESFKDAVTKGKALLRAELDKGPAIVLGYSGGAKLAGDLAGEGHRNMVAVGLVSDPAMPTLPTRGLAGKSQPDSWGITGARAVKPNIPAYWAADPKDGICLCPRNSPLRLLADFSEAFTLGNLIAWTNDVRHKIATKTFQDVGAYGRVTFQDVVTALELLSGYLNQTDGDHTSYATRKESNGRTYTENLALWVIPRL